MGIPFQPLTFDNLRGIKNNTSLTSKPAVNAEQAKNGYFDRKGSFITRKGGEKYNTTAYSSKIVGLYDFRYSNNGSQKILSVAGTNIYSGSSGTTITTGQTTGLVTDFCQYKVSSELFASSKDFCFIANGTDSVKKYDGTTLTNCGISAPGTALTLASSSAAGGALSNGVYRVNYTFISADGVESNPCISDLVVTLSGGGSTQKFTVNISVSADAQVTNRRVYMTSVGGADLSFNKVVGNNSSTTVEITANSTGSLLEYYHDVPPTLNYIETFKNRLVGAKDNRFYYTPLYKPFYWPQGELDQEMQYFFDVGDGAPITGIKAFYDAVLIFKQEDIYLFTGDDVYNFRIDRLMADQLSGAVSNRSLLVHEGWCYFVGLGSIYRTNGSTIQNMGADIADFFDPFSDEDALKFNKNAASKCQSVIDYDNNCAKFFIPCGSSTEPNVAYVMSLYNISSDNDLISPNWSVDTDYETTACCNVTESGIVRWFRGESLGYIFRENRLNGDGAEITSDVTSSGNTTLTDDTQSWTINLYSGLYVRITSGYGKGQKRIILSNTATELTISAAWDFNPDRTSEYTIGGPDYVYQHAWNNYNAASNSKRLRFVRPRFDTTGNYNAAFFYGYDFSEGDNDEIEVNLLSNSLWDSEFWDVGTWDGIYVTQFKYAIPSNRIHIYSSFTVANNRAGQPIKYNGVDKIYQMKGVR